MRFPRTHSLPVRARTALRAAAWLLAGGLCGLPARAAAQAPIPTSVVNRATATFGAGGVTGSTEATNTITVVVTAGLRLEPPQAAALRPGDRRVFSHRVINSGTGTDRVVLSATGPAGWAVQLLLDVDGDGRLGAADSAASGALPLERGASALLLLVLDVPADAADLAQATVAVHAASTLDPTVTATVEDLVSVRRPLPQVTLGKLVDRAEATPGDTLLYTLSWLNQGDGAAARAVVLDTLPAGLRFAPGTLTLNGAPLTDAADADSGSVVRTPSGLDLVRVGLGDLPSGGAGTVSFRAIVAADAPDALVNVAHLSMGGGTSGVSSPGVPTRLRYPQLALEKALVGGDTARLGEPVRFRLAWSNTSTQVAVREAVLEDTLPEGLELVSADGNPSVEGRVVRWQLGTLAPGQSGSLELVTRAVSVPESGTLVNRAVARGSNAAAVTALATPLEVQGFAGDEIRIEKQAGMLEAGIGDAVPYTVRVTNTALVPLRGVVVSDRLPAGVRFLPDRLLGADSARVDGRDLRIFLGTLAAAEVRTVRYALLVVAASGDGAMGNLASAQAEGGLVRSDTAAAWIRIRGMAMQVRTILGKVWFDANGNGRQDDGDPGVAGVEVWSADGEVVKTDRHGRYSFRNAAVGGHVLRLDASGLPAGMRLARSADGVRSVRLEGWSLPRVDFRLIADSASLALIPGAPTGSAPVAIGRALPVVVAPKPAVLPAGSAPGAGALPIPADAESTAAAPPSVPAPAASPAAPAVAAPDSLAPLLSGPARPAAAEETPAPAPATTPARTPEDRAAEARRAFVEGPLVRITAPVDGAAIASNRLYVQVRGEAGAMVRLFRGDRAIAEVEARPDGVAEFIGVEIPEAGPAVLRAAMRNSWGRERTDSIAVHRVGAPARFEAAAGAVTLRAESRQVDTVRVRVLDRWGVPVPGGLVSPTAAGAAPQGADADRSSVGLQLAAGEDGWVAVPLLAGNTVLAGELRLAAGDARVRIPLRVLPSTRPLIATGTAQVGLGAAPDAFGAVTIRGALDDQTTVRVSMDSRRAGEVEDAFGRSYDPLDESRYPTFGDGSERRVLAGATQVFSARIERGLDWVELGDVETGEFGGDDRLGLYSRSLSGMVGRVQRGNVEVRAFGSMTDQVLAQRQIRANGTSGPYRFGGPVRPGTDRVAVEVRAADNAARVIAREELVRWSDYQIDYQTGAILLQRAIPGTDPAGNPVFVVARLEQRSGGETQLVGGVRVALDAARALRLEGVDSLQFSVLGVHDAGDASVAPGGHDLFGSGLRVSRGGLSLNAQLMRSVRGDTTASAGVASLRWKLFGERGAVGAEYLEVGEGFGSSTDPRLAGGVRELRLSAEAAPTATTRLRLRHERQRFGGYDVERATTGLQAEQKVGARVLTAEAGVSTDGQAAGSSSVAQGRVKMGVTPRMDLWLEGVRALDEAPVGATLASRPDQVAVGASYRLLGNTRVEAGHRWVRTRGDSARTFGIASFNLRTGTPLGGEAWGGIERADDERAGHAAVLGMNQRLALGGGWSASGTYERRFGLSSASLLDPTRALPFAQAERDRWSAAAGVEWMPADTAARVRVNGELHGGAEARGYRVDVAADAPLGPGVALLTRHDWFQDRRLIGAEEAHSRRDRSLLGLALRPVGSNALNLLGKLEYRRDENPFATGLSRGTASGERRVIGSTDVVWGHDDLRQVGLRYAVRWSERTDSAAFGTLPLTSVSHFLGGRLDHELRSGLRARVDGRLLLTPETGDRLWNVAPALVAGLGERVEVEAGYRFGDLNDPDFARQGGSGFYLLMGVRFTESVLGGAADFWRGRILND